jgi:cleavage and polyadenylation specificity factor subunit 3
MTLSAAGIDLIKWALEGTFGSIEGLSESKGKKQTNGDVHMNGTSEEADEEIPNSSTVYLVMGCVIVRYHNNGEVELEWEGNMLNDGIADAVMAVLFSVESSPAAVKQSSSKHSHSYTPPTKNPHANLSPTERLERLFMFLEAQFGPDNLTPIATPRLPAHGTLISPPSPATMKDEGDEEIEEEALEDEERATEELQKAEIERLHKIGIPVPGIEVKVDKMVARVWLEDLEVECTNRVFGDRVRAVAERAAEVTAPLWG